MTHFLTGGKAEHDVIPQAKQNLSACVIWSLAPIKSTFGDNLITSPAFPPLLFFLLWGRLLSLARFVELKLAVPA